MKLNFVLENQQVHYFNIQHMPLVSFLANIV